MTADVGIAKKCIAVPREIANNEASDFFLECDGGKKEPPPLVAAPNHTRNARGSTHCMP
jgi:hypothetical protein